MRCKKFGNKYLIRLDRGEEIVSSLKLICINNKIEFGFFSAIGATNEVTVGLFDTKQKKYHSTTLEDDFEITSLNGNITTMNGEIYLHCHINLADKEHRSFGGHLNKAIVSATCEMILEKIDGNLNRIYDPDTQLNLFDI